MGDVVALNKQKKINNAHDVLDYIKENVADDGKVFVIFTDRSNQLVWGSNGYNNYELLWDLEEAKHSLLHGDA